MNITTSISKINIPTNNRWLNLSFRLSLYIILAVILLKISWYAWPDITIDFGNELYMPWRITQGDMMYKDIDYYFGAPLSIYWNAFWFYLFGPSLNTLVTVNLILLALLIYLLEDWLRALSDQFTATVAVLFFISVFAFGRYAGIGNYNYVTPYSHPLTHGVILILILMALLRRWAATGKISWLFLSGLILGLTVLTKIEIALAAVATATTYLTAHQIARPNHRLNPRRLLVLLIAIAIPIFITIYLIGKTTSFNWAMTNIFKQWLMIIDGRLSKISNLLFFKTIVGTDNIFANLMKVLDWSWKYINIILIGTLLTLTLRNTIRWRLAISALIILFTFTVLGILIPQNWLEIARPLPLIMAGGFILTAWSMFKNKSRLTADSLPKDSSDYPLYLASFVFAGTLLLKMFLNARIYHYGFVLTMPATMLLIVIMVWQIPKFLNRYGAGWAFNSLALGLLITIGFTCIQISINAYSKNNFTCCSENKNDIIKTNRLQGPIIDSTLRELEKRIKPGQTLTVVPEGLMLNYLLRLRNPTPYITFMPDLFIMYDEQTIIGSFIKTPPDFILIVHKDTGEYGFRFFGQDYGINLYKWIEKNYTIVWETDKKPLMPNTRFGTAIAKYNYPRLNN